MEISVNPSNPQNWEGSVLILGIFEEDLEEQIKKLQPAYESFLLERIKEKNFNAKHGEISSFDLLTECDKLLIKAGIAK